MKRNMAWLGMAAGLFAAGWMTGRWQEQRAEHDAKTDATHQAVLSVPAEGNGQADGVVRVQPLFEKFLATKSESERSRILTQILPWLSRDQLLKMMSADSFKNPVGQDCSLVTLVVSRLAEWDVEAAMRFAGTMRPPLDEDCLFAALRGRAISDPMDALARLRRLPRSQDREALVAELYAIIARSDPARAMTLVQNEDWSQSKGLALMQVFREWVGQDADAALLWFQEQRNLDRNTRDQMASQLVTALGMASPARGLALAQSFADAEARRHGTETVLRIWAAKDADAAWKWVQVNPVPGRQEQSQAEGAVIGALCQTDPVRAFAFLLTIKEAVYRDRMAGAVLEAVARKDGRQAMTLLESLPVGQTRIQALRRIATGWIESGPDELMAYMAGMLPGPDRDALVGAVAWESNRLPAASLTQVGSWMLQGTSGGEPPGQFRGFMSNFAGRDRAAALKFAQSLEGSLRSQALAGVLCQWAESRPQEAAEWASAAGDGPGMDKVLVELSGAWARRDPAAALVWARGMTAVDAKDKSVANVLWHWARSDPRRAATEVASLAGDARDAAVEKVATSWAETEPAEAANWTVTQPDSKRRTQALGQLMVTWAAANPVAASQWLGKQAAGPARDEMVARFSYQSAYLDPDSAMEWAASVGDAGRRVGSMQDVASQWMQNDPAAAREWFRSASLDAATRAALARTIK